jgi:membrane protease YdiL (CAAX protease family)
METNTVSLKTFAASIAAVLILETIFRRTIPAGMALSLPGLGLLRVVEIILLTLLVFRLEKNTAGIGLSRPRIVPGIQKGLIWSAAFGIASGIALLGLPLTGVNALQWVLPSLPSSFMQVVTFYIVGGVIAPVAEEIFFRGILYGFFRQWGAFTAVILSTLFFVFIHPLGRPIPITQAIGGIVFAIAYEREKNLMVPITIHSLGNLAIFSLPLVM